MSDAVEVVPAPTIFATDVDRLELVGESCVRYTLVEEVNGERRIVAYVVYPLAVIGRIRAHVNAWLARAGLVERPPIPERWPAAVH